MNVHAIRRVAAEMRLAAACALLLAHAATADEPRARKAAVEATGLEPAVAAAAMTLPPGFAVKLLAAEPDVRQPIAMAFDDRGRLWVAEAYSYPNRVPDAEARDRILIFADTDGDHVLDSRKVFAERLNLVSGLEVGFGGVFVGAAPQLLFIPDRDGDDRPDGEPEVLLDGWGFEDTHETLNSFIWGPDGWLYGCHGVFTNSRVGKSGAADAERVPLNAAIWRFHPVRREFEVFTEGTSNPWGLDFDDHGEAFHTACVIPHLYHDIPGARYQRQAGAHFNPFTYDDIKTIARHRHWVGEQWRAAEMFASDASGGGHAHSGAMIYLGGAWPERWRGRLFMNNIHGNRLNVDRLTSAGSGFVGDGDPDFLFANDAWSQFISLQYGPDGQVVLLDWYDAVQCHQQRDAVDRGNGRIFKVLHVGAGEPPAPVNVALAGKTDAELVALLGHRNEWFVRHARRLLQERAAAGQLAADTAAGIRARLDAAADAAVKLRALWALHAVGATDAEFLAGLLADPAPAVRVWAVRLAAERRDVSPRMAGRFAELAASDSSPVVRLAVAAAVQRMPPAARWPIAAALLGHAEDASDHNLPLMEWYAVEPLVPLDPARAIELGAAGRIPLVSRFIVRRAAAADAWEPLVARLAAADDATRAWMLAEILAALAARGPIAQPAGWSDVAASLRRSDSAAVRQRTDLLALRFGDASAAAGLRAVLADRQADTAGRLEALGGLVAAKDAATADALCGLVADPAVCAAVLKAMAALPTAATAEAIVAAYPSLPAATKPAAIGALVARPAWSLALLDAIAAGRVPRNDLSTFTVGRLAESGDARVVEKLAAVWGTIRPRSADVQAEIQRWKKQLVPQVLAGANLPRGRQVYVRTCGGCHVLHGEGGRVGPELTGSNRADLDYLFGNLVDPSAVVGRDYQMTTVVTTDGRAIAGIVVAETGESLSLRTPTEEITLPKAEIEERVLSEKSLMPENQLGQLPFEEARDLVAYLRHPTPVPLPEPAAGQRGP
jgi:putative membrane-bound dehydrogenase-like protein